MIPKMPDEYKGKINKKGKYKDTSPRKWTQEEIEWCLELRQKGYTKKEIAISVDRPETSVSMKLKRLTKVDNSYNKDHVIEKYAVNHMFVEMIKPKSILDVYCGEMSFYKSNYSQLSIITNDIDTEVEADYHLDALKFLCQMYLENRKFDLIDLDPFGSAADCFDLAIKMAKKGLCITLGEIGHVRWKRLDYVERYYGIKTLEEFTSEKIVNKIIEIGQQHKKHLIPIYIKDWKNISRVWFKIEPMTITKQWENRSW